MRTIYGMLTDVSLLYRLIEQARSQLAIESTAEHNIAVETQQKLADLVMQRFELRCSADGHDLLALDKIHQVEFLRGWSRKHALRGDDLSELLVLGVRVN